MRFLTGHSEEVPMQTTLTLPIDALHSADFAQLMERPRSPGVSLYLPTHHAGRDVRQDPIRLKNLAREAEEALPAAGVRNGEIPEILGPVKRLLDDALFWRYQNLGLAIFLAPRWNRFFRLPIAFEELAIVGDRFHLKPLLPLMSNSISFCVLALSQRRVRLFHCRNYGTQEIDLDGRVPRNREEALAWEGGGEARLDGTHDRQRASGTNRADHLLDLERYCHLIDNGIGQLLPDPHTPLVLSGTEPLVSLYREVSSHPELEPAPIPGNPDQLDADEFHARGWRVVRPRFERLVEERKSRFEELANKRSPTAAVRLEVTVPASANGRVDTLFVPRSQQCWGRFDREAQTVAVHPHREPGDEDLLDLAAVQTFAHGGNVHVLSPDEIPGPGPVAAILRY
jgi:hypothetical protein